MLRYFLLFVTLLPLSVASAAPTEYYIEVEIQSNEELAQVSRLVSISDVQASTVYAFANNKDLDKLRKLGHSYRILTYPRPSQFSERSGAGLGAGDWNFYPTYSAYVSLMDSYATNYPNLCHVTHAAPETTGGHELIFATLSDNVSIEENEPEVLYIGGIHGNEPVGYALMLRLIDSLLIGYAAGEPGIVDLIDNVVLVIAPLVNPDGMYAAGDHTVEGGLRFNASSIDLNRNFPSPDPYPGDDHPDGNPWQVETQILMELADTSTFVLSADFHNGVPGHIGTYLNYPWDYWWKDSLLHPVNHIDSQTFKRVCQEYADLAQNFSPNDPTYMTGGINDGIGHGGDIKFTWGTHQDYMTFFQGSREVIVELVENDFFVESGLLETYWEYNRVSFLTYPQNALLGIRGIVLDSRSGSPVAAMISIEGHDNEWDSSFVFADPSVGDYHRMIEPTGIGESYTMKASALGYPDVYTNNVTVSGGQTTVVDFSMQWVCGDVNGDGIVTSGDAVYLIAYVFRGGPPPLPVEASGDVNCDGVVTSADIIYLIQYLFYSGPAPCGCEPGPLERQFR